MHSLDLVAGTWWNCIYLIIILRIMNIFTRCGGTCTWLYLVSAWTFSFFKNALWVFLRKLVLTLVYILLLFHSLLIQKHLMVVVLVQIKRLIFKVSGLSNFFVLWKLQNVIILKSWLLCFTYLGRLVWFLQLSYCQYFVLFWSILIGTIYIWMTTSSCIRIYYLIF